MLQQGLSMLQRKAEFRRYAISVVGYGSIAVPHSSPFLGVVTDLRDSSVRDHLPAGIDSASDSHHNRCRQTCQEPCFSGGASHEPRWAGPSPAPRGLGQPLEALGQEIGSEADAESPEAAQLRAQEAFCAREFEHVPAGVYSSLSCSFWISLVCH